MVLVLEFFFYFLFLFIKFYSFLDKNYFYNNQGSKLSKFIKNKNIEEAKINNKFIFNDINKNHLYSCIISTNIIALKIMFTYDFLSSNFYVINLFNKKIDLISSFGNYFTVFKVLYYIVSFIFTFYIVLKIFSKNKKVETNEVVNTCDLLIGTEGENNIYLNKNGLFQNILITGSIGSGKTSSAITNILDYLLKNNIYGLILDVKGNYIDIVKSVARKYNKLENIVTISLSDDFSYNPLDKPNVSAIEIAHGLRKVLTLLSDKNNSDSYWLDKVEMYLKDFIVIIRTYNEYPTFFEIHKLVTNKDYLNSKLNNIENLARFSDYKLFEINSSLSNIKNEFLSLDDRTSSIIRSEITRLTDIFSSEYIINKKFCSKSDNLNFNSNNIYVLSINISENRKLSKIISTYLKLDSQNQILNNNKIPVFFICDEYQEFCNSEDSHFFSLSREYKSINVVSMQSYTSLINNLNNINSAKVIIQNFVNKIWFRNDDVFTVEEIIKQLGKEEKERISTSFNESSKETKYSLFTNSFKNLKSNLSEGYNINKNLENILDINYFTSSLKTFEAVCLFSDGININVYKKVKLKRWEDKVL